MSASDPTSVFAHAAALALMSTPSENEDRIRVEGTPHCGQTVTDGSSILYRKVNRFEQ